MALIPLADVQAAIFGAVTRLEPVEVDLRDALGLVLAERVTAPEAVPPFPNTAMDGYAVRAADTAGAAEGAPVRLRVVGELAAGHAPTVAVGDGEAIRIMTGAPMPDGADAIVMVERTSREDDDGVLITLAVEPGLHVRRAGGDLEAGDAVFEPGTVLTAARIGVLATVGARRVLAHPRVRVGVLSTGDELVETGPLEPGKIRDSNRPMLLAQLADAGAEPLDLGTAHDDADVMTRTLADAIAQCDAVITSGGVSVGDFDYVSDALERIAGDDPAGASRVDWYQVAIKPAKPLCIGMLQRHAGVRSPRQPGVVVRELRALRPARAAHDDGPRPAVPSRGARHRRVTAAPSGRRQAPPRPRRRRRGRRGLRGHRGAFAGEQRARCECGRQRLRAAARRRRRRTSATPSP